MDVSGFTFTKHAIARALDMGVSGEEIKQCLLYPENIYESHKYLDTMNYRAGRVLIAVRDSAVVTVGWASNELWDEDLSKGEYGGRTHRRLQEGNHV